MKVTKLTMHKNVVVANTLHRQKTPEIKIYFKWFSCTTWLFYTLSAECSLSVPKTCIDYS